MTKKAIRQTWIIMLVLILGFSCATTFGETIYVDSGAPFGGDGLGWVTAYTYLQDALWCAYSDPNVREIWVAAGTYHPDEDEGSNVDSGDRTESFVIVWTGGALYGGFPSGGGTWGDRDPNVYESILDGDLNGNDGEDFANNGENSYHVVTSPRWAPEVAIPYN